MFLQILPGRSLPMRMPEPQSGTHEDRLRVRVPIKAGAHVVGISFELDTFQAIEPDQKVSTRFARLAGKPHIVEHGEAEEQVGDLERARNAVLRQPVGRKPGHVATVELNPPRVGLERAGGDGGDAGQRCDFARRK